MQSASFALAFSLTFPPKLPSDRTSYFTNWFLHKSSPTSFVMAVAEEYPYSLLGFGKVYRNIGEVEILCTVV